jgi:hypothetical protein
VSLFQDKIDLEMEMESSSRLFFKRLGLAGKELARRSPSKGG